MSRHHHLRAISTAEVSRLARLVTGRGLGLVLGGGGARGFAHIGVLRAFDEAGIMIDAVGGASAGSLIAATYALGLDWRAIDEMARTLLRSWRVPDYTLPLVSLLQGSRLTADLRRVFGETQIEDLWYNFFCLSVNLTRLSLVVHREGSLWRSIRAGTALPLVFPPLLEAGDVLVDGGVINNLPVDIMRQICPDGPVVAVKVSMEQPMRPDYRFDASISGWHVMLGRIMPADRRIVTPSFFDILMRVLEISAVSSGESNSTLADLVIRPPIESFGTLAFSAYGRIVEAGYLAAQERLTRWRPE